MSLASIDTATRMDEIIRRKVIQVLNQERPVPRYGEITQIDRDVRTCQVQWPDGSIVTVKMGEFQPSAIGQVVRVSDYSGHLWIAGIQGDTVLAGAASADISAPTTFAMSGLGDGVYATWVDVAEADRYEVQIAEDAGFTVNDRAFISVDRTHAIPELTVGTLYHGRVRAISSQGSFGPWSNVDTATPPGISSGGTDGNAPANSPAAIVDPGIGDLQVSWVPTVNADTVTYEVHAATTSGFTPGPTTLAGETTGAFYAINRMPDNSPLDYDNNTFIRIVAKDGDGSAAPGVQGFAAPSRVGADDFDVLFTEIGDGVVPPAVGVVTLTGGKGYLFATWDEVVNVDLVRYEVHVGTAAGFTPTTNTLVEVTRGTFAFINNEPPGMGGGPVQYTTTYFVKILATDVDGPAATPSTAVSGNPLQITGADITTGSVNGTHIANLAIGNAHIANAAITSVKIGDGEITNAKIGNLAVDAAKIANATISGAKIALATITDANIAALNADKITAGTINAIDINGGTITGAVIRTSATAPRVIIDHALGTGTMFFDTGHPSQVGNGGLVKTETQVINTTDYGVLEMRAPDYGSGVASTNLQLLMGTGNQRLMYSNAYNFTLEDERAVLTYGPNHNHSLSLENSGNLAVYTPNFGQSFLLNESVFQAKRGAVVGFYMNATQFVIRDTTDNHNLVLATDTRFELMNSSGTDQKLVSRDDFTDFAFENNNRKLSLQSNGHIIAYRDGGVNAYFTVTDSDFQVRNSTNTANKISINDTTFRVRSSTGAYDKIYSQEASTIINFANNSRQLNLQGDGRMVMYNGALEVLNVQNGQLNFRDALDTYDTMFVREDFIEFTYFSNTRRLSMQNNGAFVIYDGVGTALWSAPGVPSDMRLKENIEESNASSCTEKLRQIPLVEFDFIDPDHGKNGGRRMGVLAQDVQKVHPHGVQAVVDNDGNESNLLLDDQGLIMLLLGAVKDLDERLVAAEGGGRGKASRR